jgi:hypothetical protein
MQLLTVELKWNIFDLKIENSSKDFLNCHVFDDNELNQIMILHPYLINNLRDIFGNGILEKRTYRNPGTPRFKVIHSDQD